MSALKNNIINKFANKQLSGEQLKELQKLQNEIPVKPVQNAWKRYAITLSVVFVMTIAGFVAIMQQSGSLTEKIALEVANQHIKLKPLEISSDNFTDVQNYFEKLDFRPVHTEQIQGALIGGRYCSLRGQPAAQFRFIDKAGNQQTLYQAEYTAELFNGLSNDEEQSLVYAKGIPISIWMDKGIVFALTQ